MATAVAYAPEERPALLPMPARAPIAANRAEGSEFSIRDVVNALRYHLILFLILGTLMAIAGAAAGWTLFPARYTTYAMLRVASSDPTLFDNKANAGARNDSFIYQGTQAGMIKSHKILKRAYRKPEVLNLPMLQGLDDPIAYLEEKVAVEYSEKNELMKVVMAGEDPQQICKIVNGIVDAFTTEVETYRQQKQANYDLLLKTKAEHEKSLDDLWKTNQAQFGKNSPNEAVAREKKNRLEMRIRYLVDEARIRNELQKARELLDLANARAKAAESIVVAPLVVKPTDEPLPPDLSDLAENDPAFQKKQAEVTAMDKYIANQKRIKSNPNSPEIQDCETKLVKLRSELEDARKFAAEKIRKMQLAKKAEAAEKVTATAAVKELDPRINLQAQLDRLTIEERQVREELAKFADLLAEDAATGPTSEQKMMDIKLVTAQTLVSDLDRLADLKHAELKADDRVSVVEKAHVPQNREMKKQIAFTGLGGFAGLGLVAGLITVGELRRKRVYSSTDPVFTKLPLVGRIPEHGFVAPADGAEPADDDDAGLAFRAAVDRVKTLTLRQMSRKGMKTLLVTSPGADEGKSILAWNLAAGFARTDYKVLFIDANLARPTIHEHLNIEMPQGLAEALRGEATLTDIVLRTPVPNLFCIAAGVADEEAHQCLDKPVLTRLLEKAKKDFDYVVIDSCALGEAVDPMYLAQRVDAAIVSLRTFRSRVGTTEQACRRLTALGTPILGAVLTDPTLTGVDV